MFFSRGFLAAAGLVLLAAGLVVRYWEQKAESGSKGPARVAILAFENQTGDDGLNALAGGFPRAVAQQLDGGPDLRFQVADSPASAKAGSATHLLHGRFTAAPGGTAVELALERLADNVVDRRWTIELKGGDWSGPLAAAARELAQTLLPGARPALAKLPRSEALRSYLEAHAAPDPAAALAALERSIAQDPTCGWCWTSLPEFRARVQGAAGINAALEEYRRQKPAVDAVSQARLELFDATSQGDEGRKRQALERLVSLRPGDEKLILALAEELQRARVFDRAEGAFQKLRDLDPANTQVYNMLGYVRAYQGKFDNALGALEEYAKRDTTANPLDSQGEVMFMAGRFAEAEKKFLACHAKDPDFASGLCLEKAALARLLSGDVAAAGAMIQRYLEEREKKSDALTPFHRARWNWLTGNRGAALAGMQPLAESDSVAASLAAAKLTIWAMEDGDAQAAREWALESAKRARRPADRYAAAVALSLAGDGNRIQGLDPAARLEADALRLTLQGKFEEALPVWGEAVEKSRGGSHQLAASMQSWVGMRLGRNEQPAGQWPVLTTDQLMLFDSLVYQNVLFSRARVAPGAESRKLFDTYLRSMGDAKDRFGQMKLARGEARL